MEDFLKGLTLDFFSKGKHKLSIDEFTKLLKAKNVDVIDVRSKEENSLLCFSFAKNIPLHELPKHINEIPKDRTVAVFCSARIRGTIAYFFLHVSGFENVKVLDATIGELADALKPGLVAKLCE